VAFVHATLAEHELLAERPADARRRLAPILALPELNPHSLVQLELVAARAALADQQDPDGLREGEILVLRTIHRAMTGHIKPDFMETLWVHGIVRSRQQRWDEAERLFTGALSIARQLPYPQREATIQETWGKMLLARADLPGATERFEAALTIYRRLGATPAAEHVERLLSRARG
jgi:hypothetical protein